MSLTWWILGPALLALAVVLAGALRRPILLRMALRNLQRRRAQALAIALGLMVGTAIISGSLATGDSMTAAIRQSALQAFGPLDESVAMEGRRYFPASVADALERDPRVRAASDGVAPLLVEDVAVGLERTRQWEPRAALIGLDPAKDARFGPWATTSGGVTTLASLQRDEAGINQELAETLGARPGDVLGVRYALRPDPLLPRLSIFNGSLSAAVGSPLPLPLPGLPPPYVTSPLDQATFAFPVDAGAVRVTAVLLWGSPGNRTDLDVALQGPSGQVWNTNGTLNAPDAPALLNASAEPGTWEARVASKAAANQPFTLLVLVFYPATDLAALQEFLQQVEQRPEARPLLERVTGGLRLEQRNFTIRFIAAEPGRGSFLNAPDVFVRLDAAQEMYARERQANLVMVSNPGDEEQGLLGTARAMAALDASLADQRREAGDGSLDGLEATPLKQQWVDEAERAGGLFSSLLTTMGSFSILAGLILIGNIFVMLTEERRTELGIARALGLRRSDLTRLFVYEGAAYAVLAAAMGALLGLAVSYGLIAAFNAAWAERILLELPFRPTADAVLLAFGAGVLMTLGAVAVAAQRASRLNIVRSIRKLEEPDTPLGRRSMLAGALLLALALPLTAQALLGGSFVLLVLAPNLAILGATLVAARFAARSLAMKLAGLALVAFNLGTVFAFDTPSSTEGIVMAPVRGALLVLGAVLLIVQSRKVLRGSQALLARFRSLRPIARTALAYPLHKKLRTGMTVLMFGLVLTVVVLFSIFFAMFTPNLGEQGGGFDVRADSTIPVQDLAPRLRDASGQEGALRDVERVASLEYAEVWGGNLITVAGQEVRYNGPPIDYVYGYDAAFVRAQDFPLLELDARFATPREAYEAVLRDPSLIIVSRTYSNGPDGRPGAHHVGDRLTMESRHGPLDFTIVAIQKQLYYDGVFVGKPVLEANFDALHGLHLVHVRDGGDPRAVARAIEASQQDLGMDAASVEEEAEEFLQQQRRLYVLFEVYLGLGLVLGIASLGIITARSVLERRQEIGMLRALGLPRSLVFRSFVIEGLFIVTLGALIGLVIGILVAWGVHLRSLRQLGIPFVIPWGDLALILGVAFVATLAATLGPARRAARLPPAEAIRYIE